LYEAKPERNLLGIVSSNSFRDHRVYERFRNRDGEFLKEMVAINYVSESF